MGFVVDLNVSVNIKLPPGLDVDVASIKKMVAEILSTVKEQGVIMNAKVDALTQAVADVKTAVGKIPAAIDAMEAKVTTLVKNSLTDAEFQQVQDAIDELKGVAATATGAADDAADGVDEADVPPGP